MKNKLILSSGPTSFSSNVLQSIQNNYSNQDLDNSFKDIFKNTINLYDKLITNTTGETIIMTSEAMLALEASCLNLIEKGDNVLVVANGIFGAGFEGLVKDAGGNAKVLNFDWKTGFPVDEVLKEVDSNSYSVVTMVHCETPTGVTNDVKSLCQELRKRNILSIVDSVSAVGGEELNFDNDCIDVLLCGSQKCLSLPADLSIVTLSQNAIKHIEKNSTLKSYYLNFLGYINAKKENRFLYTQCIGSILALETSLNELLNCDFVAKHAEFANLTRNVMTQKGFKVYAQSHNSNTVTAFYPPKDIKANDLFNKLLNEHDIVISKGLGILDGEIIRIGHMGNNNNKDDFDTLFSAIDIILSSL